MEEVASHQDSGPSKPPTRVRTEDVQAEKTFLDLGLPQPMIQALSACGFDRPSPVQQAAIPLGVLGSDLIVQAKSGTGKTVVFATICLGRVKPEDGCVQALIVAPTREIAIQSQQVIERLATALSTPPQITCGVFVGGLPIQQDEKKLRRTVQIAVGTPGRLMSLIEGGSLSCDGVTMFVLDEADALLGDNFYAETTWLYDQLPRRKQVMAFSATYSKELLDDLEPLLKRPQRVMLCQENVSLKGVRQFFELVDPSSPASSPAASMMEIKVAVLLKLLSSCSFHQASVFCNDKPHAEWLARRLCAGGFPAMYLGADLPQEDRQRIMADVRAFKTRVVVSTDVLARGVDLDRINLVISMDVPRDAATYVHRVGRTGRFGTRGVSVCLVTPEELVTLRQYLETAAGGDIEPLPQGQLPADLYACDLTTDWEKQALASLQQATPSTEPPAPTPTHQTHLWDRAASSRNRRRNRHPT